MTDETGVRGMMPETAAHISVPGQPGTPTATVNRHPEPFLFKIRSGVDIVTVAELMGHALAVRRPFH